MLYAIIVLGVVSAKLYLQESYTKEKVVLNENKMVELEQVSLLTLTE